jgi:hypothetical protein
MILTRDGVPGEHWFNLTPEIWWQWSVAPGCCELCLRLDAQMVRNLKPPLHPRCKCTVDRVEPLHWSPRPFATFREKVRLAIRRGWGADLFSLSAVLVVRAGLVTLDELIEGERILDLAEVVGKKKLSVDQLVAAGIHPPVASKAVSLAKVRAAAAAKAKTVRPAVKVEVP